MTSKTRKQDMLLSEHDGFLQFWKRVANVYSHQIQREVRRELFMSKVVVFTNLTLDGVMQAPGRPDEDRRGAFEHGGWATPYAAMAHARKSISSNGALLLGRRTYDDFYAFWPNQTHNPHTETLNSSREHAASST